MMGRLILAVLAGCLLATGPAKADWFVEQEPSEMAGHTDVRLSLPSEDVVYGDRGQRGRPVLFIACTSDVTTLTVDWGVDLGTGQPAASFIIDGGTAAAYPLTIGSDGRTAVLQPGSAAIPAIRAMLGHARLEVSMDSESGPLDTSFAIAWLDQAIGPLRQACGW